MSLGVDLEGDVRRVDPDRWLASRFIADRRRRSDVIVLYAFDHELARAETAASNPLASEIRLVWWRESLAEIAARGPHRRHPVVDALAEIIPGRDLPLGPFEAAIDARIEVLGASSLTEDSAVAWARGAQGNIAYLAALVLGARDVASNAEPAGAAWGLHLLRRMKRAAGLERLQAGLMDAAREGARKLPTAAFPAALVATLARAEPRSAGPSALEKQARLTWAALTGRL